jgi:protein-disulfide isomerase
MREKAGTYFRNLIAEAKTQGLIKVTGAKLPELPRVKIEIGDSPTIGPKNAPITLVEFADFQCPFCYSAEPTVKAIMAKYKDKIKLVFKNYPLISLHPQAVNASMAAECAQEQGKFWEMHDILFENHAKLADNVYSNFAKTVGLNIKNFDTCYTNPATKEKVMQQEAYGQSLGINATPAFYINGILLMGAQPESEFIATIDKELENKNM